MMFGKSGGLLHYKTAYRIVIKKEKLCPRQSQINFCRKKKIIPAYFLIIYPKSAEMPLQLSQQ